MDPRALKRALRDQLRRDILAIDPLRRRAEEAALVERFVGLPGFAESATVLLYASAFPEEFDTTPILRLALESGRRVACPRVVPAEGRLALHEVREIERDLKPGIRDIPEPVATSPEVDPSEVDWVLVPGLGFDRRCFRIGRGAGHYDRLLPRLRGDAPRWSLCLSAQWVDALPVEPHDQPLDGVADAERVVTRP